jgi:hypothetical protein
MIFLRNDDLGVHWSIQSIFLCHNLPFLLSRPASPQGNRPRFVLPPSIQSWHFPSSFFYLILDFDEDISHQS